VNLPAPRQNPPPILLSSDLSDLFEDWISSRSKNTKANYLYSIKSFSKWCEDHVPESSGNRFVWLYTLSGIEANRVCLRFREWMREENLSPASVNNRLGALRSFASLLHALGAIPWTLAVRDLKNEPYRETKGPGLEGVKLVLKAAEKSYGPRALRDKIVILMLYTLGLRVSELCALNVEDLDLVKRRVHILGKGKTKKEWLNIPFGLYNRLLSWLEIRSKFAPEKKGPLILSFACGYDTSAKDDRMGRHGVYFMVGRLGERAGVPGLHPHSLRHSAITEVLRTNGGNIAKAMRFSRHKDPKTVMVYEDNLEDAPGEAAAALDAGISGAGK